MTSNSPIAPFITGLDISTSEALTSPDSFTIASNVHLKNGYVKKRSGYRLLGKLVSQDVAVSITDIERDADGTVTANNHGYFSDDVVYLENVVGMEEVNGKRYKITTTSDNTFLLNVNTSSFADYISDGISLKEIDPSDRVMGIATFIKSKDEDELLAFSTKRANIYSQSSKSFNVLDSADIFSSSPEDFVTHAVWAIENRTDKIFFTNGLAYIDGNQTNGIRYYDGVDNNTTLLNADLGHGETLYGGRLIFLLRQYLVVLNTFEHTSSSGVIRFPQRARWCANGNYNDWLSSTGHGGFVDAPSGEEIISASFVKDFLIVFFTSSVWTLRPLPNEKLPFRWDKINSFNSCGGKMASIGFDGGSACVGNRGIILSDGVSTERIDGKIDTFCSEQINADRFRMVFCSRDYIERKWWTLYPSFESDEINKALIFDEDTQSFTTYDINLNCLGWGFIDEDLRFKDFTADNNLDIAFEDFDEETYGGYSASGSAEVLLGGTVDGSVVVLDSTSETDLGEPIKARIYSASWNPFITQGNKSRMNFVDIKFETSFTSNVCVECFSDSSTNSYFSQEFMLVPSRMTAIVGINNIVLGTTTTVNVVNHGLENGEKVWIYGVVGSEEFNGNRYTVTVLNSNNVLLDVDSSFFGVYIYGGSMYERSSNEKFFWKRIPAGGVGYSHRILIKTLPPHTDLTIQALKPFFKIMGDHVSG